MERRLEKRALGRLESIGRFCANTPPGDDSTLNISSHSGDDSDPITESTGIDAVSLTDSSKESENETPHSSNGLKDYDVSDQGDDQGDSPTTRIDETDVPATGGMKQNTIRGRTNPAYDILEKEIGSATRTSTKETSAEPDPEGVLEGVRRHL